MSCLVMAMSSQTFACPISQYNLDSEINRVRQNKFLSLPLNAEENITEEEFNSVVYRIKEYYTPIFKELGKDLNVYSDWSFPMNNAFATQDKNGTSVYFFGLFTKNKYMSKDAFLFVACHEIGHHLGGFPKNNFLPWASVEGQADYFAASKCYRELLENDSENAKAESLVLPESIKSQCKTQYTDEDQYRICLRAARAAEDVGKLIDYMNTQTEKDEVILLQPEPAAVAETSSKHPAPICRAIGILQAALCNRPSDIAIDDKDETIGACHEKNGDVVGNRVHCWFKPSDGQTLTWTKN